ncbi:MAG: alpha-2-macroglobulin family protein [Bacteroidota bacterium]
MRNLVYRALAIVGFSIFLMSPACKKEEALPIVIEQNTTTEIEKPKQTINTSYPDLWKSVDSLTQLGLYKSALDKVQMIMDKSIAENNSNQLVKSVIHKLKFNTFLTEDEYVVAIDELDGISKEAKAPLRQLIHSITADVYWGYFQNNRWKFENRTETVDFKNEDIRTWDLKRLADQTYKHYLLSLSEIDQLQSMPIADFNEILSGDHSTQNLRPTLYDFLAHKAFDYFRNAEAGLNRPADKFHINDPKAFGDASAFLALTTESQDTMSNLLYATRILKDLTAFHRVDKNPEALIDVELKRLQFVRGVNTLENKDELYLAALEKLANTYQSNQGYTEICYHIALQYQASGNKYSKENPDTRYDLRKAIEICEKGISKYPNSYGASFCESLINTIQQKHIYVYIENAVASNTPSRFILGYKNVDKLYFRVVKLPFDFYLKNHDYNHDMVEHLLKEKLVKSWEVKLEDPKDFQNHTAEYKMPELATGQYAILASPDKDFALEKNAITYTNFWISNLSYNKRFNNSDGTCDIFVTDRKTGKPMKNVTGAVYLNKYNYVSRDYSYIKQESYHTDELGMFTIKSKNDYRSLYLDLSDNGEHYNEAYQLYVHKPYHSNPTTYTTHFFTDRSIYRPGQTIYFKGIHIKNQGEEHTIETGKELVVRFYDVNYQLVKELKLTTNEFGTVNGSFVAPQGVLNGSMTIQDGHGTKYISVEEYKRPKFETSFKPVAGVFKLGQKITVEGQAKSYAGANIDGAQVQFRVVRGYQFPYWLSYRYRWFPNAGEQVEILNGEVQTDESGNYKIEFEAKEDPTVNKKYYPTYSYNIIADVTDVNGETQSTSTWVNVGYTAMTVSMEVPAILEKQLTNKFAISTRNLMGEKVKATGSVAIWKVKEPAGVFRKSIWERPDYGTISDDEFRKLFPNDPLLHVSQPEKGDLVAKIAFNTDKDDSVAINRLKEFETGQYIVEASAVDAFGETVTDIKTFTLLDKTTTKNASNSIFTVTALKNYCEPGENAEFLIATAAEDVSVLYEIFHKDKIIKREIITISKAQKLIKLPISEAHRGNISVLFTAVKFNENFSFNETIVVPYSNKQLDITFETFRDKLQPGQLEEWKVKIKGPKGEKVLAELLATMYDASLDQFAANSFYLSIFNSYYSASYWSSNSFDTKGSQLYDRNWNTYYNNYKYRNYDQMNWFGYYMNYGYYRNYYEGDGLYDRLSVDEISLESVVVTSSSRARGSKSDKAMESLDSDQEKEESAGYGFAAGNSVAEQKNKDGKLDENRQQSLNQPIATGGLPANLADVKARSNFNETAFFMPALQTDENGEVIIKFTIPESLTKWKFLALAHTKDLKTGTAQKEVITQKELMVTPNAPRFLREGDHMFFAAKIDNLSEGDLDGTSQLFLFDALTGNPVDVAFNNTNAQQTFTAKKGQSASLAWEIDVPFGVEAVTYKVVAQAKNHTDGEEMALPILTNRILVTESMPLPSKKAGTKEFYFEKLINSKSSSSIKHHSLTLEYTSNPAWYAIQAMPYMMEYPYECAEQTFTRYYANSIASEIVNSSPKIKQVFESWKTSSPDAFLSNLEKNQELKSVILEETPWVLDAKNESERKKRVGLLFDLTKMDKDLKKALDKIEKLQVSNGGWPWFAGMRDNRYITQHIITGMGHLDHLGVKDVRQNGKTWNMVKKGVKYLDDRILEDYEWMKKHHTDWEKTQQVGQTQIQYLYARSYFKDIPVDPKVKVAFDFYQNQAHEYWKNFDIHTEAMIALQAQRYAIEKIPTRIMASLKERAILHDELGMYWKDNVAGYYWYQAPIETQALMIEAFDEITDDQPVVEELKVWLLKNKQTNDWKTTKATAEACYALLLKGTAILERDNDVTITMGGKTIDPKAMGVDVQAGTGYFKTAWSAKDVKPEMGKVTVTKKNDGVSWGAIYWQYFEDLDKITSHETNLKLNKKLFLVKNTNSGPVMSPVDSKTKLKPGDKIRVRIELRTDRDMEYVHMKDMRASGFEPVSVFSQYKWQDGLGYYETTKDASTNFFMDYLRKGTYVFEYDVRVAHYGNFSNGITTIQCMYAPEFTSHSEGIRVEVKK